MTLDPKYPVIFYDDVCVLCNRILQMVIRRDVHRQFRFAALSSELGRSVVEKYKIPASLDSFLLLENNQVYSRSEAALRVAKRLKGFGLLYRLGSIIPAFIRNKVYDLVSRVRYRVFGKRSSCWLPTPDIRSRFLDHQTPGMASLPGK